MSLSNSISAPAAPEPDIDHGNPRAEKRRGGHTAFILLDDSVTDPPDDLH
ncbi:hypothetical protein ACPOL_2952 [Acidisarcina polymorpha]|uniref:Uncharacterized protein n=1 Tax=Acidisarcina polymorpha TaxID=2211140 RepID=A0A2Z5G0G4_9BACT|nr:hypothetical protein ACPOL_2952 [Acidisarcina polymorpha]